MKSQVSNPAAQENQHAQRAYLMLVGWCVLVLLCCNLMAGCGKKDDSANQTKTANTPNGSDRQLDRDKPSGRGRRGSEQTTVANAKPINAKNFPLPAGASKPSYEPSTSTIMYRSAATVKQHIAHYDKALGELGWKKEKASSEVVDGVAFLEFNNGSLKISITMNPDRDGNSMMSFAQGSGVEVPEELSESD